MISLPPRPPLLGLFGAPAERRAAFQYWIRDTVVGGLEWVLYHLFKFLPIDWCSNFGAFVSRFTRHLYPASELRARKLWAFLHPDQSDPASVDAAMDRLWRSVSRTMWEFPLLDRLWEARRISVEHAEYLDRARDEGQPILITMVHLGNWEVAAVAIVEVGHPGAGLYLAPDNRFEHSLAVKSRIGHGARLIQAGPNSIREALKELKSRRGPFAIFIDEVSKDRVQAPAFGRRLGIEGNIAFAVRLAVLTGAALIPVYCVRDGDCARFSVKFLPPVDLVQSGDRDADLAENVRRLDALIAPIVAKHADQWYFALDFEFDTDTPPARRSGSC